KREDDPTGQSAAFVRGAYLPQRGFLQGSAHATRRRHVVAQELRIMARREVPCMQQVCGFLTFADLLSAMACSSGMLAAVASVHEIIGTASWDAPHAGDEHAGPDQFLPSHLVLVKKLFARLTSLTIQDCCLLASSDVLDILKIR